MVLRLIHPGSDRMSCMSGLHGGLTGMATSLKAHLNSPLLSITGEVTLRVILTVGG